MPGKAAKVIITKKQQQTPQSFANSKSVSIALALRSKIILLAFQGLLNEAIEAKVGLQRDAVGRWRGKWQNN